MRLRLRTLANRVEVDRELEEEFRDHLEREIERNVAAGMTEADARATALQAVGGVAQLQEECRDERGTRWLEVFAHDLRHGFRLMRRSPGFSAAAVQTVALGMGAATSIFSVVYGVLLRPLPYPEPDRLVSIWMASPRDQTPRSYVGAADYRDWKDATTTLQDIALVRHIANYNLTGEGEPEGLMAARVTANLFGILGVAPAIGRTFTADAETEESASYVAVLSDRLWRRRFGADPSIVGRRIRLNGSPHTVLGVMPPQFRYPTAAAELWTPLYLPPEARRFRAPYNYMVVGRLKPGVTLQQAQTDLSEIGAQLAAAHAENRNTWAEVNSLLADTVGPVRTALYTLLGAVGCLLAIGVANVANLFLARGLSRTKDRALRSALGASRGRLAAQAMTEVLPVVILGALCGTAAAMAGFRVLLAALPPGMPRLKEVGINGSVLGFSAVLLVRVAALVAFWPALQAAGTRLAHTLRIGERSNTGGRAGAAARELLVVCEVALTVMLVAGSCLLARSFAGIRSVSPGFAPRQSLVAHLAIPRTKYPNDRDLSVFARRILDRVESVPGVVAAGMVNRLPIIGGLQNGPLQFEGVDGPGGRLPTANWRTVTPGYFRAIGIPLIAGRLFTEFDREESKQVGLIDAETARRIWPNQSPIGKRFRIAFEGTPWVEIVGVVGSVRNEGVELAAQAQVYWNYWQRPQERMALVVRTAGDPARWMPSVVASIRAADPEQPVYNTFTMEDVVDRSLSQRRLNALLVGVFAGVSLLLAAVGIYGVMSYAVEQRTREFGIRMALGAKASDVVGRVVMRGAAIGLAGSAIGLAAVGGLSRFLQSLLFHVSATDWVSYSAAAAALIAVALLASFVPAQRAVSTDPMRSLRGE
jgi:putative ABC transport system permease protein